MDRFLRGLAVASLVAVVAWLSPGCSSSRGVTADADTGQVVEKGVKTGKTGKQGKKTNKTNKTGKNGKTGKTGKADSSASAKVEKGKASYYADKFQGRATASGQKYDKNKMTAAHKTLPFGTVVRVTNTATGKSVDVTVNDRGPFAKGRIVDVSRAAAEKLGMIQAGVINCTLKIIKKP